MTLLLEEIQACYVSLKVYRLSSPFGNENADDIAIEKSIYERFSGHGG